MKKKLNTSLNMNGMIISVLIGTLSAVVFTLLGTVICSYMINRGLIGENGIGVASLIIWFASAMLGTLICYASNKSKILPAVLITISIYILLLMGLKIILFDAPFCGIGKGILCVFAGTIPSIMLSAKQKSGKKTKFKYSPK